MPYVPSEKTVPPAEDRKIIDAAVDPLAQRVASEITHNSSLRKVYRRVFVKVAFILRDILNNPNVVGDSLERNLARAIYETGAKYGYEDAFLGEFNYAFTRFIQLVPAIKVAKGDWKVTDELRYWLYGNTASALIYASRHTEDLDIGVDGIFIDIKDEYKWIVNRPYEIAQILKSGHCYFAPFYSRPVEVVDEDGKHVGYLEIPLQRSESTLNKDLLDYQLVLRKKQ